MKRIMKIPSVEAIVAEVTELRHKKSMSRRNIYLHLKKKYDLNHSRAYELINLAAEKVALFYKDYNKNALEEAIQNLEDMKERARGKDDIKMELEIQKELDKINELSNKIHQEHSGSINIPPLFPDVKYDEPSDGE